MADQAKIFVLWARRIKLGPPQTGAIEIAVRVTNTGTVAWTASSRKIRGHVVLAAGVYFQDAGVVNAPIAVDVAQGATIDQIVQFCSQPTTAGLALEDLWRPDTMIVVDVVQETVGWIGTPATSFYVRDANSDRPDPIDVARRLNLMTHRAFAATVGGAAVYTADIQPAANTTAFLERVVLSASASTQRVTALFTPAGGVEAPWGVYQVSSTQSLSVELGAVRVGPGERWRLRIEAGTAATLDAHLDYALLPWAD